MINKPTYEELQQRLEVLERTEAARDQADLGLIQSEKSSRAWLEHSPMCTKIIDLDYNLQYMSRSGIVGLGIEDINEYYGKPYPPDYYPEAFKEQMTDSMAKAVKTGEIARQEGAILGADGKELCFQSTIVPVKDDQGQIDYLIVVSLETTAQNQAAKALEAALTNAEAANAAKSDFLANMSHEIRTPMNGILGTAELMLLSELPDDIQQNISVIHDSGTTLMGILNDILDISKIEAGAVKIEYVETDLAEMLGSVFGLLNAGIIRQGLAFHQSIPEDLIAPTLLTDASRIRQILLNLLDNARKFTHAGSIKLSVSQTLVADNQVETRFEVTDTGIGLSAGEQARVFDSFSQADESTTRAYGGTGLGLSISRELVELMGGNIGIQSVPGQGSTFWFTIVCAKVESKSGPDDKQDLSNVA